MRSRSTCLIVVSHSTRFVLLACLLAVFVQRTQAGEPVPELTDAHGQVVVDQDQIVTGTPTCAANEKWLISTRSLGSPSCSPGCAPRLSIRLWQAGCWTSQTLDQFIASSGSGLTVIYLHGNRIESQEACREGDLAYRSVLNYCGTTLPVRFVIFSWPSSQIRGQLKDVRQKAVRTNADGYYLAWLLARMSSTSRITLIGHSYGARIATGAAHLLAGGRLAGRTLVADQVHPKRVNLALIAPAIHCDWLRTGRPHGNALLATDGMLLFYNPSDPVLRLYRFVEQQSNPQALGYTGMNTRMLGQPVANFAQCNVSGYVGRDHSARSYFASRAIMNKMRNHVIMPLLEGDSSNEPITATMSVEP